MVLDSLKLPQWKTWVRLGWWSTAAALLAVAAVMFAPPGVWAEPPQTGSVATDRAALVALYEATDGANWTRKTNWLSGKPLGEWSGVETDGAGRVIALGLSENGLKGPLPAELGNLANLKHLHLNDNDLSGTIPVEFGNLANLLDLVLSDNALSGLMPAELGNLPKLRWLGVGRNPELTGCIPHHLTLRRFTEPGRLTDRFVTDAAPPRICSVDRAALVALYEATGGGNFPHWPRQRNWLTGKPVGEWQGVTTNSEGRVTELDLSSNGLAGTLPVEFADLDHLQRLRLAGNLRLAGCIPYHLRNVDSDAHGVPACSADHTALVALYRATGGADWTRKTNWLSAKPLGEWHGVTTDRQGRVTELSISNNKLTGTLPAELGDLAKLQALHLQNNDLSGAIPAELGNLASLQNIILQNNDLSGAIPAELGNLSNLQQLKLQNNDLSGAIPAELGNLSNLQQLTLFENNLSGSIPAQLGSLANLNQIYLASNDLSGAIPAELGNLANLQTLYLQDNDLSGAIPAELGRLANLQTLYLQDNDLSGAIPVELRNLANLRWLKLAGNPKLTGCVPRNLRAVNDAYPRVCLSGPAEFNRTALVALYEATDGDNWHRKTNWLSAKPLGEWESVGTNDRGEVTRLLLPRNNLRGEIPVELGYLTKLEWLWLAQNPELTGCIPHILSLRELNIELSGPRFCLAGAEERNREVLVALYEATGGTSWKRSTNWLSAKPLDEWYGVTTDSLGRVTDLYLNSNALSGTIPTQLGNLTNLKRLRLASNPDLGGCLPYSYRVLMVNADEHGLPYCPPTERQALETLYVDTDGWDWKRRTNWLSAKPLGEWHGVSTDRQGRVTGLSLEDNDLSGTIPAELGRLANLQTLNLARNDLSGVIPAELGSLTNLLELNLHGNDLSGVIPVELGRLASLQGLWLYDNELSGAIPAELGNLVDLKWLWLYTNDLSGAIPAELGRLAKLQRLSLVGNPKLTGCIPYSLRNVQSDPNGPRFCLSAPAERDRAALAALYHAAGGASWTSSTNWLSAKPLGEWYGVTTNPQGRVTGLSLDTNDLSGPLPAELGHLANLLRLSLDANDLSGAIPAELGNLANLERLSLDTNELSGAIPAELGRLTELKGLWLYNNELSGAIPAELGRLAKLEELWLSSNALSGAIPAELGDLAKLRWLALEGNPKLTGCVPRSLYATPSDAHGLPLCTSAERLALTELYGATSGASWANSKGWLSEAPVGQWYGVTTDGDAQVTGLSLPKNRLAGTLPADLGDLVNLESLVLNNNDLSGAIPAELGRLANLQELRLDENDLIGEIPAELGNLANLQELRLGGNDLIGEIPVELGSLSNLRELRLGGNDLIGEIPAVLGRLANLQILWLSENDLRGTIPVELGRLANLQILLLSSNELSGPIPASLGSLAQLDLLLLYDNELSGAIPAELGRLTGLQELHLQDNELSGTIPAELGDLAKLHWLSLAGNDKLVGCIPQRLRAVASDAHGLPVCVSERQALVTLYGATGGVDWTNHTKWLSQAPLGEWYGVTTDDQGQVTGLSLSNNGLAGTLPAELGSLINLQELGLGGNDLSGAIPAELSSLTNLQELGLDGNALSGAIPAELGNLAELQDLKLAGNPQLTGCIPYALHAVPSDAHGLPICPPTERQALVTLYATTSGANWQNRANWLSEQPLGEWHGVTTDGAGRVTGLDLSGNKLAGALPAELGQLAKLKDLRFTDNDLSGPIPAELGRLTDLELLLLGGNDLSGSIPAELGQLAQLDLLLLYGNELSGTIPAALGRLTSLNQLHLDDNELSGRIPTELGNLTGLSTLTLARNDQLTGCIPHRLRAVPSDAHGLPFCGADYAALEALYEATGGADWPSNTNWLSAKPLGEWHGVTTEAGGRVTGLSLKNNALSGTLPVELGSLTKLESLALGGNTLSGTLPAELGNLVELKELHLSGNELSGAIPVVLGSLTKLQELRLSGNALSGEIPAVLGNLAELQELHLSGNALSGEIPAVLGNLVELQELKLAGNAQLTGCIPYELRAVPTDAHGLPVCAITERQALAALYDAAGGAKWTSSTNWLSEQPLGEWHGVTTDGAGRVTNLVIDKNNLNGVIPQELGSLAKLRQLRLNDNTLRGVIPAELGRLANLRELRLRNNDLSGVIPAELGSLTNLRRLYLSGNDLSGSLPAELGNLANLQKLWLSGNDLSGAIPAELGSLANLQWLWLSGNDLSGAIPAELGRLANLQQLRLNGNDLSGTIPAELGNLTNLQQLRLAGNAGLTGCVPYPLRNVDSDTEGLPVCAPASR